MPDMTDAETAAHIRTWLAKPHGAFSWPTDICGYDQHMKFVTHRNENWNGKSQSDFPKFVSDYADALEAHKP